VSERFIDDFEGSHDGAWRFNTDLILAEKAFEARGSDHRICSRMCPRRKDSTPLHPMAVMVKREMR